jgi:hypothetical protein
MDERKTRMGHKICLSKAKSAEAASKRNGTRLSTIRTWGSPTSIRSSWPKEDRCGSQSREEATKLGNELMVSMGQ